jgi:hypothetical protein
VAPDTGKIQKKRKGKKKRKSGGAKGVPWLQVQLKITSIQEQMAKLMTLTKVTMVITVFMKP